MIDILKNHPFFADKHVDTCDLLENQGYCNENYLVVAEERKYIVRKLLRDDIDREFEWNVNTLAHEEGIAAEPLFFDRVHGFMVFAFLEGVHKKKLNENDVKFLAYTVQKLHSINIDAKPIALETDTSTIDKYPKEYVLCHNDLNPQNIFFSDDIKFIDWEYAGVNDRYFDLACVCVEFELSDVMQEVFLAAYFEDEGYLLKKLEVYKTIYTVLCEEWFKSST